MTINKDSTRNIASKHGCDTGVGYILGYSNVGISQAVSTSYTAHSGQTTLLPKEHDVTTRAHPPASVLNLPPMPSIIRSVSCSSWSSPRWPSSSFSSLADARVQRKAVGKNPGSLRFCRTRWNKSGNEGCVGRFLYYRG